MTMFIKDHLIKKTDVIEQLAAELFDVCWNTTKNSRSSDSQYITNNYVLDSGSYSVYYASGRDRGKKEDYPRVRRCTWRILVGNGISSTLTYYSKTDIETNLTKLFENNHISDDIISVQNVYHLAEVMQNFFKRNVMQYVACGGPTVLSQNETPKGKTGQRKGKTFVILNSKLDVDNYKLPKTISSNYKFAEFSTFFKNMCTKYLVYAPRQSISYTLEGADVRVKV